ncbi:MAG: hypothetical protein AAF990_03620 [Bacteroidota bacterium]
MRLLLKTLSCLLLVSCIFFSACNKEVFDTATTDELQRDSSNIEDLNVPDGFDYSSSRQVAFNLKTVDAQEDAVGNVLIYLFGVDQNNQPDQLQVGITNAKGQFSAEVTFANHFKEVMIRTVNNYKEVDSKYAIQENISAQLVVD